MNSYKRILRRRNTLYFEYKVLCKTLFNFSLPYHEARELYNLKEKIYDQFIFYQNLLESLDKDKNKRDL